MVEAVFSGGWDKLKAKRTDRDEGPSTQKGEKNKKDRRWSNSPMLVAVADRAAKQPQQGLPNHFHRVIPRAQAYLLGQIDLPGTFDNRANFRSEVLTFEVVDFPGSYHAILGRPCYAKF